MRSVVFALVLALVGAGTAAAAPAALPALGWSIDVAPAASASATATSTSTSIEISADRSEHGLAEDVIALTAGGTAIRIAVVRTDDDCVGDGAGAAPTWAPPRWTRARPSDRPRGYGAPIYALCRDLESGSVEVWLDAALDPGAAAAAAIGPVLAALERTIEANDVPPRFDGVRAMVIATQETADDVGTVAGTSHAYVALALRLPPRQLARGLAVSAGLAGGRAGGALLADAYVGGGYGVRAGPLAVRALVVAGVDRIGGGFAPVTAGYAGAQGYARLALGDTYAIEAEAMRTWGTDHGEVRAELRALSASRDSLIALGAFYQHWQGTGVLLGVSFGLAFGAGG